MRNNAASATRTGRGLSRRWTAHRLLRCTSSAQSHGDLASPFTSLAVRMPQARGALTKGQDCLGCKRDTALAAASIGCPLPTKRSLLHSLRDCAGIVSTYCNCSPIAASADRANLPARSPASFNLKQFKSGRANAALTKRPLGFMYVT